MKKTTIILLGLAFLLLAGFIVTQYSDIAGMRKTMAGLMRERDMAWNTIKTRDGEISDLKQRLRNLEDAARNSENKLANFQETVKNLEDTPVSTENQENELDRWLGAIPRLRDFIKQHPEYAIPEFKYLTDKDWLAVTEGGQMESEADYRDTLAKLRERAKTHASIDIGQGIRDFAKANNGNPPNNITDIKDYMPSNFDFSILERYTMNPSGQIGNMIAPGDTPHWIIREAGPVDDIWDTQIYLSSRGETAVSYINNPDVLAVRDAIKNYENETGVPPTNFEQLGKYIHTKIGKGKINEIFESMTNNPR